MGRGIPGPLRIVRRSLVVAFVAYALVNYSQVYNVSVYYGGIAWDVIPGTVFLVLAAALYAPWVWVQVVAGYAGIFVISQALLTPMIHDFDYITVQPNVVEVIDVRGDVMRGIQGVQRITTDEQGYRVTRPIDYDRPSELRIFAVGGSTTEQPHHDDHRTWTSLLGGRLEALLGRDVEMINTGVSGLRSPHHLATLKHVSDLHPNAALFLMGLNDWNCHIRRAIELGEDRVSQSFWLLEAHRLLRGISFRGSMLGTAVRRITKGRFFTWNWEGVPPTEPEVKRGAFYAKQFGSLHRPRVVKFQPDRVDPIFDTYLRRIIRTCEEEQITCVFVTQPNGYSQAAEEDFQDRFWMTPPQADYTTDLTSLEHLAALYNRHVMAVGEEHGIPVCDAASQIEPSFRNFFDDGHFNLEGSKRMAEVLAPCVAAALRGDGTTSTTRKARTEPHAPENAVHDRRR